MRAYTHGGVGHTDSVWAQHFWLGKTHYVFLVLLTGFELGSRNVKSDALPTEPECLIVTRTWWVGSLWWYVTCRRSAPSIDKTRLGPTSPDKTRLTRQDKTPQDRTKHDKIRQDKIRHDKARHDRARPDKTRQDKIRHEKKKNPTWQGTTGQDPTKHDKIR